MTLPSIVPNIFAAQLRGRMRAMKKVITVLTNPAMVDRRPGKALSPARATASAFIHTMGSFSISMPSNSLTIGVRVGPGDSSATSTPRGESSPRMPSAKAVTRKQ